MLDGPLLPTMDKLPTMFGPMKKLHAGMTTCGACNKIILDEQAKTVMITPNYQEACCGSDKCSEELLRWALKAPCTAAE